MPKYVNFGLPEDFFTQRNVSGKTLVFYMGPNLPEKI